MIAIMAGLRPALSTDASDTRGEAAVLSLPSGWWLLPSVIGGVAVWFQIGRALLSAIS